jgi:hypothetical protein
MTAAEVGHGFSAFMPSSFTIRKFAVDRGDADRLRSGYGPSLLFAVLLGAAASAVAKDWRPLAAAVIVSIFMIWQYERAISIRA